MSSPAQTRRTLTPELVPTFPSDFFADEHRSHSAPSSPVTKPKAKPKQSPKGSPRGLFNMIKNWTFGRSDKREDIDWKVARYQTFFWQLKNGLHHYVDPLKKRVEEGKLNPTEFAGRVIRLSQTFDAIDFEEKQLKNFIKTRSFQHLNTVTREMRDELLYRFIEPMRTEADDQFVPALRRLIREVKIIEESEQNLPWIYALEEIAKYFFSSIVMDPVAQTLVKKYDTVGAQLCGTMPARMKAELKEKKKARLPITFSIEALYRHFCKVPLSMKAYTIDRGGRGVQGLGCLDPVYQSNLPQVLGYFKLSTKEWSRSVKSVRFGTPTVQVVNATVSEEFEMHLRCCRRKGERQLFIIKQSMVYSVKDFGAESRRVPPILELTKEESGFSDTFFAVCWDMNTPFYYQGDKECKMGGRYDGTSAAEEFKEKLRASHFEEDSTLSGNYIADNIYKKVKDLKERADLFSSKIHEKLFNGHAALTVADRQNFIDFFRTCIDIELMIRLKIDILSKICRDAADRAAQIVAANLALLAIVNDLQHEKTYREQYEASLLTPAEMIKKRGVDVNRYRRNVQAVKLYEENAEAIKKLFKLFWPGVTIYPEKDNPFHPANPPL